MQIEKNRKNRWQIEFNSETLTLTLGERGRRTYWVYASPMAALVQDPRSPFRRGAAQDALPLPAGTPGRTRAGSKARRHPWRARWWRAHPPASARAGEQAAAAPPRHPPRGHHGRHRRLVVERGGVKMF